MLNNNYIDMDADNALVEAGFRFIVDQTVLWGDMDAMQHLNNTRYFRYCETARIEFIRKKLPDIWQQPSDALEVGVALAEVGCRFRVPITYPDSLAIGIAVTRIDDTEFEIRHDLYSQKLGLVAAQASAKMVYFDFQANQRAMMPPKMVRVLEEHQLPDG